MRPVKSGRNAAVFMLSAVTLFGSCWVPGVRAFAHGQVVGISAGQTDSGVDEEARLGDMFAVPSRNPPSNEIILVRDLDKVPEIRFQDPPPLDLPGELLKKVRRADEELSLQEREAVTAAQDKFRRKIGQQFARINSFNEKKTDHFMELLIQHRPDLAGLPFTLGNASRLGRPRAVKFANSLFMIRLRITRGPGAALFDPMLFDPENFWKDFAEMSESLREEFAEAAKEGKADGAMPEKRDCVTALMQILGGETSDWRLSLIEHLPKLDDTKADRQAVTEALLHLAIYSMETEVRRAALKALSRRDASAGRDVLRKGLRYPWPQIARNAAEAVVHLKRYDLGGELVDLLDEPDPRSPYVDNIGGKKVTVMRELVRIHHSTSCILCHPPATLDFLATKDEDDVEHKMIKLALAGKIPVPDEPPGYGHDDDSKNDNFIRADVTYLRQDFSLLQKTADSAQWIRRPSPDREPGAQAKDADLQRFDFIVRKRVLNKIEAATYQALFNNSAGKHEYRETAL